MRKIRIALFTGNYNHIRDGVSLTLNRLTAFLLEKGHDVLVFGPTIATPALEHAGELVSVPSDRKSTRLNSSHVAISYAVFCLKKKKTKRKTTRHTTKSRIN